MARPRRHENEQLKTSTYRISSRHKFLLRLLARQTNRDDGPTIEYALEQLADRTPMSKHWLELWDEQEAVRVLNLFGMPDYKPSTEEHALKAFALAHAKFFWTRSGTPHRARAVVLWPHIWEVCDLWRQTKHEDYPAAERKMLEILAAARLEAPTA